MGLDLRGLTSGGLTLGESADSLGQPSHYVTEVIRPVELAGDADLVDVVDLPNRRVSLRACSDARIYELELDRVFARAWICVGHESEIPHPGDFMVRHIGEDSVIVTRDRTGAVNILLNACAHRGMQVCRVDTGSARNFRCPYHGWVYSDVGSLIGVPAEADHYGDSLDKSCFGLRKARVACYGGFVFGCWDDGAPSLEEYLGGLKWYLDMMFCRTDAGLEVLGPPQRWVVNANWKLAAEQFSGDSYHTLTAHRSMAELHFANSEEFYASLRDVARIRFREGHGVTFRDVRGRTRAGAGDALERAGELPPAGVTPELMAQVKRRLSPAHLQIMREFPPGPLTAAIFPNLFFLCAPHPTAEGEIGAVLSPRMWNPKGPDKLEATVWMLVEKDAPEEFKELCRRANTLHFGDSGVIEQDDAECWVGIQRGLRGHQTQRRWLQYDAVQPTIDPEAVQWPGPIERGVLRRGWTRDDPGWDFWLRWNEFMANNPWAYQTSTTNGLAAAVAYEGTGA